MEANQTATRRLISAKRASLHYWADIWHFRELFLILAKRDIAVRYKQTSIGIAWAVLRPLITTAVFTVMFGIIGKFPDNGVPYAVIVLSGMLPWQLFSGALMESSSSLIQNQNLVTKVYFPRMILPLSSVVVSLIDFLIALVILCAVMVFYGFVPSERIIFMPIFVVFGMIASAGAGIWLAALNVKYRDFRYVVPFLLQLGLFISPVGFTSKVIPEEFRLLYSLNPMAGVINGFRWSFLGDQWPINVQGFFISFAVSLSLLFAGIYYFRKTERSFADVI